MARFEVIAAILVALSAIALEAEALKLDGLRKNLTESLSPEDLANAEKAFSVAKQYMIDNERYEAQLADELLPAWERVVEKPDQCDELSLGYLATIADTWPENSKSTNTLAEASHKYASKCLTPGYIKERIDIALERFQETSAQKEHEKMLRDSSLKSKILAKKQELVLRMGGVKNFDELDLMWPGNASFETEFKFIDDQFIDYSAAHPEDKVFVDMKANLALAIANAMTRELKEDVKGMKVDRDRYTFLWNRLIKPCSNYSDALRDVMWQIRDASRLLEGRYEKLIASLDKDTRKVYSRLDFCKTIESLGVVHLVNHSVKLQLEKQGAIA